MRYSGMDGIKGLALIGVIWYHLSQRTLPGGFIGVEVFYTVSGFLLATSLLNEYRERGAIRVGRFYVRRLLRLWPALVVMVPTVACLGMIIDRDTLVGIAGRSMAALTFSTNWYEIATGGSYFASTSPQLLRHLWFVALMAQVIVVLPVLVALTERLVGERLRPLVLAGARRHIRGADGRAVYAGRRPDHGVLQYGHALLRHPVRRIPGLAGRRT